MEEKERQKQPQPIALKTYDGGLRLIDEASAGIEALDAIVAYGRSAMKLANGMRKSLMRSNYIARMRSALTPEVMGAVMYLQGSELGFLTDKDKEGGYPVNVVRDCVISAAAKGLSPVENQFNIIGGRMYVTTNGCLQILADLGVRHSETAAIPQLVADRAKTKVLVEWEEDSRRQSKELEFEVRLNKGMGVDGANGKAIRKARMWLVNRISGMTLADADAEEAMAEADERRRASSSSGPLSPKVVPPEAPSSPSSPAELPSPEPSGDVLGELSQALVQHGIQDVTAEEIVAFHEAKGLKVNAAYCVRRIDAAAKAVREWRGAPRGEEVQA
ncbi:MAG: hypothetical protein ACI4WT_04695 [Oligosphaeraceae bacterium]